MKNPITLIFLFCLTIHSAYSQSNNVTIEGQILGYSGDKEVHYLISPVNGGVTGGTIQPDSLGKFKIEKYITGIEFFYLIYSQNGIEHQCKLILRPNEQYLFVSKGEKESRHWKEKVDWRNGAICPDIYSKNKNTVEDQTFFKLDVGQMSYNMINNIFSGPLFNDEWDLNNPDNLMDTLQTRINYQVSGFSRLLEKGEIDETFFEIAKLNVEYMHAQRLLETIHTTCQMNKFQIEDSVVRNKLYKIYPQIFERYPVKGVKMKYLMNYDTYTSLYLNFLADYENGEFQPKKRKGPAYAKVVMNSDSVLTGEANKFYKMKQTMSYAHSLELNSPQLAKRYIEENPDMKNTEAGKFLEETLIPRAEEFAKLSMAEIPEEAIILDNKKPLNSFNELADSLKGKPLLIDCWGTWCSPCRSQFHFTNKLKPYLRRKGIAMVYIAFEYELDRREIWENFIKAYDLKGYHFIASEEFEADFKKLTGLNGFPNFVIVNSQGEIVEPKAAFASDGDKLKEQIIEKLEL